MRIVTVNGRSFYFEDRPNDDVYFEDRPKDDVKSDSADQPNASNDTPRLQQQSDNEINEISKSFLEAHNTKRALHCDTQSLQWDQKIADEAQQWASKLIKENGGKLMHCNTRGDDIGENLFVAMSTREHSEKEMAEKVIDKWYREIENYNFNKSTYTSLSGHFTQLIWASSTHVGVGYAQAKIGQFNTLIVCARYKPAGNIVAEGYFEKNVKPLK